MASHSASTSTPAPPSALVETPNGIAKPKRVRRKPQPGDPPPVKRVRTAAKLSRLADLSIETITDVLQCLDPPTLLACARTSKAWRQLLMTKSSGWPSASWHRRRD